jgi:hypothetical protein
MQAFQSGPPPLAARQPFTWSGVAALAVRPGIWGWCWTLLVALALGGAAGRFAATAWWPALDLAVRQLPDSGEIRGGRLYWPTNVAAELVCTPYLAVRVNPRAAPAPGQAADVVIELLADEVSVQSLFGYWVFGYPRDWGIALNRPEVEPAWSAWRPHLSVLVGAGVAVFGVWCWAIVALVAAPVVRLLAALLRRAVTLGGCWRLGMAALLPGGLVVAGGLLLYAGHGFRLLDFLVAFGLAHLVGPWLALGAVWRLPRRRPVSPFAEPAAEPAVPAPESEEAPATEPPADSPFAAPPAPQPAANPFAPPPAESAPAPETAPALESPPGASEVSPEQPLNPS